jgi:anti-anti-sigma factor
MDALTIDTELGDDYIRLRMAGEIDLATVGAFAQALADSIVDHRRVYLDIAEVRFIDSAGLSVLARFARDVPDLVLVLERPQMTVRRVLDITGIGRKVEISD